MSTDCLDEACLALGINDSFVDNWGTRRTSSREAVRAVVDAMASGVTSQDVANRTGVVVVRHGQHLKVSWSTPETRDLTAETGSSCTSPQFVVLSTDDLPIAPSEKTGATTAAAVSTLNWVIVTESGDQLAGDAPVTLCKRDNPTDGHGDFLASCVIRLPDSLDTGYHELEIEFQLLQTAESQSDSITQTCLTKLIQVPQQAWNPYANDTTSTHGVSLQLYSLNSDRNWGVGDFADLELVCSRLAAAGFDSVGLNPLNALFTAHPERCSPYSPSSRTFLNPIYIDVMRVPGAELCPGLANMLKTKQFAEQLASLRQSTTVDYKTVMALKLQTLHEVFTCIYADNNTAEDECMDTIALLDATSQKFQDYWQHAGQALLRHAEFQAFDEHFSAERQGNNWHDWPEALRDPDSPASRQLSQQLILRVRFYVFLQWAAELQLASVADHCDKLGMQYGLYLDLAVGVDFRAGDVWADQEIYADGVHVGAPPDELGPLGQDWQLTPFNPNALTLTAYAPMVEMLRSSMRFAGVLRLDHVMGLLRQYWCIPAQAESSIAHSQGSDQTVNGCYVDFPFDDLMGVIALESHRNECVIVGEDLGTVPDGFRENLEAMGILGYRVLYFERNDAGEYQSPAEYPRQTLATAATHDLPTLAGYFLSRDITVRSELGHYVDQLSEDTERQNRAASIAQLVACIKRVMTTGTEPRLDSKNFDSSLKQLSATEKDRTGAEHFVTMVHRLMSTAGSQIIMLQLEDLLLQENMVNLPGTVKSYPNWQHRLPLHEEELHTLLSRPGAQLPEPPTE